MVWGCFAALGLRCLAVIKEILNSCSMIMILNRLMHSQIAEDKNLTFWKAKANWYVDKWDTMRQVKAGIACWKCTFNEEKAGSVKQFHCTQGHHACVQMYWALIGHVLSLWMGITQKKTFQFSVSVEQHIL